MDIKLVGNVIYLYKLLFHKKKKTLFYKQMN